MRHRPTAYLWLGMLISTTLAAPTAVGGRASVAYEKRWVAGLPVHVVTVDLNDLDVRLSPVVPLRGIGRSESWARMINRARPTAAITGTFFDTRSLHPTGDIVVDGSVQCHGVTGTAIGIGWNNEVTFIPMKRGEIGNWSAFQHVIVAGPTLISEGRAAVYPKDQGFRDSRLFARRRRTAVGITRGNKLLMVAVTRRVYLSRLAKVMRALGAVEAAALDGGGSTALYCRGRTIVKPARSLTNLLVAYDDQSRHEEVRHLLAPDTARWSRKPD